MARAAIDWFARERVAFERPEDLSVSEWADANVVLQSKLSAEPGRWRTERAPYQRGIMDALADPAVDQVTFVASTQVGKTQIGLNWLGYVIDQDPGPMLYVMPTETDARGLAGERIRSMIRETPAVAAHTTDAKNDLRGALMTLDRMNLRLGWADSDSSLASMPCRYVVLDELGKYRIRKGAVGADRVKLAQERTRTFRTTRKILKTSTPEDTEDLITREWGLSDRRRYWLPCPHCSSFAPLVFPKDREVFGHHFAYNKDKTAHELRETNDAWFECSSCGGVIDQKQRAQMLLSGVWCPDGAKVNAAGEVTGQGEESTHRGFHVWQAYSPWVSWGDIAADWLDAQQSVELLKAFVNNTLGEPWEDRTNDTSVDTLRARELPYPAKTVPEGVVCVTVGVDVQLDHLWFVVRGWCYGERSFLIDSGRVETFEQLDAEVLEVTWPTFTDDGTVNPDRRHRVFRCAIDSGYAERQQEVYNFCRPRNEVCIPTKGAKLSGGKRYTIANVDRDARGRQLAGGLHLWTLQADFYKDKTARLMQQEPGAVGAWYLHESVTDDYRLQLTSEHKVRDWRGGQPVDRWVIKKHRSANHLWDCEVLSTFAMETTNLPSAQYEQEQVRATAATLRQPGERKGGWIKAGGAGSGGGWLSSR